MNQTSINKTNESKKTTTRKNIQKQAQVDKSALGRCKQRRPNKTKNKKTFPKLKLCVSYLVSRGGSASLVGHR